MFDCNGSMRTYIKFTMDEYVCLPQMMMQTSHFFCNCVEEEITNKKKKDINLLAPELFFFNFSTHCI